MIAIIWANLGNNPYRGIEASTLLLYFARTLDIFVEHQGRRMHSLKIARLLVAHPRKKAEIFYGCFDIYSYPKWVLER